MRSRKVLIFVAILTLLITLANGVLMVFDDFIYSIDDIPRGTLVRMETKGMGTAEERTISIYKVENSLGMGILSAAKTPNSDERNIYWQVGVDDVTVKWTEANRALFSAEGAEDVVLNVDKDHFDCRVIVEESFPAVEIVKS